MDMGHAKQVCEACYLGLAVEGVKPAVNPNVQGVGIGHKIVHQIPTEERAVQVYVTRKVYATLLPPEQRIPDEVEGVPTDVIETGTFSIGRKFPPVYQRRVRPAPPGVSVGHHEVSAGTFGALVRRGGDAYMLSNNHVLAKENEGSVGDPVIQPGKFDGGEPARDTIARLTEFVPLDPQGTNLVDAALAKPNANDDVTAEVVNIGAIRGEAKAEVDAVVRKSGRTTRLTEGRITAVDVTLRVGYARGFLVFTDQLLIGGRRGFSGPGDSGSLVVDRENHAVGLLFGGSPFTTVANRFSNVAEALNVKLVT